MIKNKSIERSWKYETKFANDFHYVLAEGTPNTRLSGVDTDVLLAELSTFGVNVMTMSADGDKLRTLFAFPAFMDTGMRVLVRVLWTSDSTTAADTATWALLYRYLSIGNDVLSATVDTALDTVIPAASVYGSTSAYRLAASAWGEFAPGTVQPSDPVQLEVGLTSAVPTNVYFVGLQFAFVPSISTDEVAIQPGLVNPS